MNKPFEVVEIKHNKAIDKYLVLDIAKKTHNSAIDRYYILTTFDGVFVSKKDEIRIIDMIADIKKSQGIDIITNGIITTLKYYLRFIDNYDDFLTIYTKNLINDAKNSMEIKDFHIHRWNEIVNKFADRNKQNIESTKIRGRNV
jgi:DNA (cytosine-5)-methyltransferase 1